MSDKDCPKECPTCGAHQNDMRYEFSWEYGPPFPFPAAGPWIPVGERLPVDGVLVLVVTEHGAYNIDCHRSHEKYVGWEDSRGVTHWAEIRGPK